MKGGMYRKMDSALYLWFRQQREKGIPVTGLISLEKATEFHKLLYADSTTQFSASYGFQWRFGIKNLAISGEKVQMLFPLTNLLVLSMNLLMVIP